MTTECWHPTGLLEYEEKNGDPHALITCSNCGQRWIKETPK